MSPDRLCFVALVAGLLLAVPAQAIVIQLDYSYDTNNFFGSNPAAVASLNAAAEAFTGFSDELAAVVPGGDNEWTAEFAHPGTGGLASIYNLVVPADTLIIYVGGMELPGTSLASGGPGGYSASGTQGWLDTVQYRGQAPAPDDFGPWGGSISFDSDRTWHFGVETPPPGDESDFLSVAVHEMGHVLGFGTSVAWFDKIIGAYFTGAVATTVHGGNVPLENAGHWQDFTMSTFQGLPQEAAMTTQLLAGSRKLFTVLDYAGTADIGWEYPPPGDATADGAVDGADYTIWADHYAVSGLPPDSEGGWFFGNFNEDDRVDGGDYTIWADNYGFGGAAAVPEPAILGLLVAGTAALIRRRRS